MNTGAVLWGSWFPRVLAMMSQSRITKRTRRRHDARYAGARHSIFSVEDRNDRARPRGCAVASDGKTAVYVFNAGEDVTEVQKQGYLLYLSENGLGPAAFPSLKKMEAEVVGMGLVTAACARRGRWAHDVRGHRLDYDGGESGAGLCAGTGPARTV